MLSLQGGEGWHLITWTHTHTRSSQYLHTFSSTIWTFLWLLIYPIAASIITSFSHVIWVRKSRMVVLIHLYIYWECFHQITFATKEMHVLKKIWNLPHNSCGKKLWWTHSTPAQQQKADKAITVTHEWLKSKIFLSGVGRNQNKMDLNWSGGHKEDSNEC